MAKAQIGDLSLNTGNFQVQVGGETASLMIGPDHADLDGRRYAVRVGVTSQHSVTINVDGRVFHAQLIRVTRSPRGAVDVELVLNGEFVRLGLLDHRALLMQTVQRDAPEDQSNVQILAPMPGLVARIEAKVGDSLNPGTGILILEAMKMENEIRSPSTGILKEIRVRQGQNVEKNEVLATVSTT